VGDSSILGVNLIRRIHEKLSLKVREKENVSHTSGLRNLLDAALVTERGGQRGGLGVR